MHAIHVNERWEQEKERREGNEMGRSLGMSLASAIWGTLEFETTVGHWEKRPAGCGPGPARVGSLGWRKRFRGVSEKKREIEAPAERQRSDH